MAKVFISHSSHDLAVAIELREWLIGLGHETFLDADPHDGLAVGDEWEGRLHERLRWADAVVCILTQAYLDSVWCSAELGIARSRGSRIFPLRFQPGLRHPLLNVHQYVDYADDPDLARTRISLALRRIDSFAGPGWPDDRSPFPGLRPFEADMHRAFFGRRTEVEGLQELLRSKVRGVDQNLIVVVGPSGSGKSSLVRAGLLPSAAQEPRYWPLLPMVPGQDPVLALANVLVTAGRQLGLGWDIAYVIERLEHPDGLAASVEDIASTTATDGQRGRVLLVIDQFEEIFTLSDDASRIRFGSLLRHAVVGSLDIVATLRSEFLEPLLTSKQLSQIPIQTVSIRPLTDESLRSVVLGPAQLAGLDVHEELVNRLVDDTGRGEALPLLAFTLSELSRGLRRGDRLSVSRYDELGGVSGAVRRQADAALVAACAATGRSSSDVIGALLRLVTVDEQGRPTRWRLRVDDLPETDRRELDAFVSRRLLVVSDDADVMAMSVAHEAFLTAWRPLASAIQEAGTALKARSNIEREADQWDASGRPESRLWMAGQLASALSDLGVTVSWRGSLRTKHQSELNPRAVNFLHASIRRDRFRRGRASAVLALFLVLAIAAAGMAVNQQRKAQRGEQAAVTAQRVSMARQLTAEADNIRSHDPRMALKLGLAANSLQSDDEARAGLVNTLTSTHYSGILGAQGASISGLAFLASRELVVSSSRDGTVSIWNLATNRLIHRIDQPFGHISPDSQGWVRSLALSTDGRTLAVGGNDGNTSGFALWDVSLPDRPRLVATSPSGAPISLTEVSFGLNGRLLAAAGEGAVSIWDLADLNQPRHVTTMPLRKSETVRSIAVAADGRTVSAALVHDYGLVWDISDRKRPRRIGQLPKVTGTVAYSPKGRILAVGEAGGRLRLYEVSKSQMPRALSPAVSGHGSMLSSIAYAADGRTLVTGSRDRSTIVWDVNNPMAPTRVGAPLVAQSGGVFAVAISANKRTAVAGSSDGTIVVWDLGDGAAPTVRDTLVTSAKELLWSLAVTQDGGTLATVGDDGSATLWDTSGKDGLRRLGEPFGSQLGWALSAAFSPNGNMLAVGGQDGTVVIWDVSERSHPKQVGADLKGHDNWVDALAWTPDGRVLASGSWDKRVVLWDLTDPTHPRQLGALEGHEDQVCCIAITNNGGLLISGSDDGTVILADIRDASHPRQLGEALKTTQREVPINIYALSLSADDNVLGVGTDGGTVWLWDVSDPTRPHQLGQPLNAHPDAVTALAFAPNTRTLVTGSSDHTVRLWDMSVPSTPRLLGVPLQITGEARFAAVSSTDAIAVAHGATASVWDTSQLAALRANAVEESCALAGGGLDPSEWAVRVPGQPYRSTC
jgi:WD40 repeat protein